MNKIVKGMEEALEYARTEKTLQARLRDNTPDPYLEGDCRCGPLKKEAADCLDALQADISALEAENASYKNAYLTTRERALAAEAQLAEAREALTNLVNEASGWGIEALAEIGGWSNARALEQRLYDARALLTKASTCKEGSGE